MSTKSRQTIFGSRIRGAKIHADNARLAATRAIREADRAEAEAWSIRMEGFGGPAQPSPTIRQCLNGGPGLVRGRGQPRQNPPEPPPRRHPPPPRHARRET